MHSLQSLECVGLADKVHQPEVTFKKPVAQRQDGGYAWVILSATFFANSLVAFHFLTFGIFAPEFASTFSLSESEIGLIASLRLGLFSITGTISGPLVRIFGCRPLAMTGSLLITLAFVITAFAENRITVFMSYGPLAGVGTGMTLIPSIVIVQQYFNKRRAIAGGVSSVGVGFFSVVCSPLARFLIDTLGWRGAAFMFGGFSLQMLVATALYRPLEAPRSRQSVKLNGHSGKNSAHFETEGRTAKEKCLAKIKQFASYFFDKKLFNRCYILFLVGNVCRLPSLETYYIRQALIALSIGMDPARAAILPSIIAISTTVARGISGVLAQSVPPHAIFGVFNLLSSVFVFVAPFLPDTFLAHAISCAFFGFCLGIALGIEPTVIVTLVGVPLLPLALSWSLLFVCIFQIFSSITIGRLLDETGSYNIPLWGASTLHFLGGLCIMAITFVKWKEKKLANSQKKDIPVNDAA